MSHTIPFNTLRHFERMIEAGFTEKQAKAQTEAMAELVDEKLATKNDLKNLENNFKKDLKNLENALWLKMTMTFGGMLAVAIGILDFLLKR